MPLTAADIKKLEDEQTDVTTKRGKLENFLSTKEANALDDEERNLLRNQSAAMNTLGILLEQRVKKAKGE